MCERDGDCESGLICSGSDIKTCIPVTEAKKQYGKFKLFLDAYLAGHDENTYWQVAITKVTHAYNNDCKTRGSGCIFIR